MVDGSCFFCRFSSWRPPFFPWIGSLRCRSTSQAPIQLFLQPASKIKPDGICVFFPKTTSAASSESFRELLPPKILHKCPIDLRKEMSAQFSMRSLPQKCLVFKSVFSNKKHGLGGLDGHDAPNEKWSYPFCQNHGKVKITLNERKQLVEIYTPIFH